MKACNTLSLDVAGLWNAIQKSCYEMINEVAEMLITMFGSAIQTAGAGKHEWRENAAKEFKKISEEMTDDLIKIELGLNPDLVDGAPYAAQIMVALFGNHPPIYTKPGSTVWNDDMSGLTESVAGSIYGIPQFNWPDPHMDEILKNCFSLIKIHFKNNVGAILQSINFADYV